MSAFTQLRALLATAPVLDYPNLKRTFILDTHTSIVELGVVLSQSREQPRSLSPPKRNDCVTRRELFAVMAALGHFCSYLYGQPFLLRTDNASLTWLLNFKEPEAQLVRWLERLQDYEFTIQHRAGRLHGRWMLCPGGNAWSCFTPASSSTRRASLCT